MPIQFSPDDFQNNDFQLAQNNAGDLVLEHKQTGGRFKFDATTDSWVPVQGLDLQGADIVNVGASKTNFTEKADLTSSNGVLQSSQLPDLAITNIDVVANQSERLSLTAEEGDVAVQTDISQTFILATNDPTVDSNWKKVQLDVLGAIDGQTITPAQTGTSTNPTTVESDTVTATNVEAGQIGDSSNRPDVFADTVDANQLSGVSTGGIKTKTRAFLSSSSSTDPIPLDRITYDPDGNFDTTTHKYTVPATGTYQVSATIRLENSIASGTRADFFIALNGSAFSTTELVYQSGFPSTSITDVREFTSGDQITLGNSSGRSVTDSENNTFLVVLRLE